MDKDGFQLDIAAAEKYETSLVPAVLRPLAQAVLAEISIAEHDVILDAACGTGVVAREVRVKVGSKPRIVGFDLNQAMIETANSLPDPHAKSCIWEVADVTNTHYDNEEFSLIFCQQGLQYFPDKPASLKEMYRLLAKNGRFILTVWSELSPLIEAIAASVKQHIGLEAEQKALSPFAFRDEKIIGALLAEQDYAHIKLRSVGTLRVLKASSEAVKNLILSTPAGMILAQQNQQIVAKDVEEGFDKMQPFKLAGELIIPQKCHLFIATK